MRCACSSDDHLSMSRALVVEDHARMRELIVSALARAGIAADSAVSAAQAVACAKQVHYEVIVLDRGLPDGDGVDWLRRLRADAVTVPCLLLTARDALHDRVDGLEAGADDYLAKPFAAEELVARVRALMRRQRAWVSLAPAFSDLTVDPVNSQLQTTQGSVRLSFTELQLMLALVRAQGGVVRRSALEAAAWGLSEAVTPNALDVALHRLRRKLILVRSRVTLHNAKGIGHALATDSNP